MAGTYAAGTAVPVSKSRDEIERILLRFGASGFEYRNDVTNARVEIAFEVRELRVAMTMQLPRREEFVRSPQGRARPSSAIDKDHEQACRQRWRTLTNGIKAKLAMIDDHISTVEREFLADIVVTPDGATVADWLAPRIREIAATGAVPPLDRIEDASFRVIALSERTGS